MKLIPHGVSTKLARSALQAQKNSPQTLFAMGVAGSVCSTVLACRATLKLSDVLEETKRNLDVAESITDEQYAEAGEDRRKDLVVIYTQAGVKVITLYGPSVLLGIASIYCLTRSHGILQQRNLALTAAYAAVDEAFSHYREKVIERHGEEEDRLLRYDTEIVETEGPRGGVTRQLRVAPSAGESMYARYFDQYSTQWQDNPDANFIFLKCEQRYWNDKLQARGHVFLNEVYASLGLDHTVPGAVVGWIKGEGDDKIDFGLFDDEENVRQIFNGRQGAYLLDFNVDGVIYDKIDAGKELESTWQR